MMETTIEQKREAVLAECDKKFAEAKSASAPISSVAALKANTIMVFDEECEIIYLDVCGHSVASLWAMSEPWEIEAFHWALGLETRAEWERTSLLVTAASELVNAACDADMPANRSDEPMYSDRYNLALEALELQVEAHRKGEGA